MVIFISFSHFVDILSAIPVYNLTFLPSSFLVYF